MLYWALLFFVVAIIAAVLGFGGIAVAASDIAQVLFFVFLVFFVVALFMHTRRRRAPADPMNPKPKKSLEEIPRPWPTELSESPSAHPGHNEATVNGEISG